MQLLETAARAREPGLDRRRAAIVQFGKAPTVCVSLCLSETPFGGVPPQRKCPAGCDPPGRPLIAFFRTSSRVVGCLHDTEDSLLHLASVS